MAQTLQRIKIFMDDVHLLTARHFRNELYGDKILDSKLERARCAAPHNEFTNGSERNILMLFCKVCHRDIEVHLLSYLLGNLVESKLSPLNHGHPWALYGSTFW